MTLTALILVLFFGGFGVLYVGLKRAVETLDLSPDRFKRSCVFTVLWSCLALSGAGVASGAVTYWLSLSAPSAIGNQ